MGDGQVKWPVEKEGEANLWEIPGEQPCMVYGDSAESLGRVTTPLGDLRFTNLFGSDTAMARQFGRRSSLELQEGALNFLGAYPSAVRDGLVPAPIRRLGAWAGEQWLNQRLLRSLPGEYLKSLRAFAEGAGIETESFLTAQLLFDFWGLSERITGPAAGLLQKRFAGARRYSPLVGSLSLILPSQESGPLHLKTLDNSAVDRWDRKTTVAFYHPDRGLGYVLVSTAGFLTGLPTGMNSAGLTLSVEPGNEGSVDFEGVPLGPAAREVLSRAHTIEEGASILRQYRPIVPWRYVVTEGDTGRVAVLHSHSGGVRQELFASKKIAVSYGDQGVQRDQSERFERWHRIRGELLLEVQESWEEESKDSVFAALQSLGHSVTSDSALPGHPICGLSNVAACLFEPQARRLWVAAGRAPSGRRWFVPLTLRGSFHGEGTVDRSVRPLKPALNWDESPAGRALENLRHAYRMSLGREEGQRILITLEYALALDNQKPALHLLAGLMALKTGRARRAQGAFERALQLVDDPIQRSEITLYLGWAFDLQGDRKAAKKLFGKLIKDPHCSPRVRSLAQKYRRLRFKAPQSLPEIDFILATVLG